ncbi:hypothetical protein LCGC14_0814750 [marine sediment metagenome]|uniref:Uncharacterized protein n=1 Tax=marine sediment metagenome TaxID=412755 RepID=A0A0F9S5H9_9ZZZZ
MTYSVNPFKWLLWLYQKIKWRKSKWQKYYISKPLSKAGKAAMYKELRDIMDSRDYIGIPPWMALEHKSYGESND